jgi:hypothetical protein
MTHRSASRTNPALWERVKREVTAGSQGGPPGKWSARKAQLAVARYKSRGGGYKGSKDSRNSLTKWSREKWDYVSPRNKKSRRGRYLPLKVRQHMSRSAKSSENRKKGTRRGQWVPYGREVKRLMHKYHIVGSRRRRSK